MVLVRSLATLISTLLEKIQGLPDGRGQNQTNKDVIFKLLR